MGVMSDNVSLTSKTISSGLEGTGGPVLSARVLVTSSVTVQAWMGRASIATTNHYLHHLGTPPTGPDWSVSTLGARRGAAVE